MAIVNGQWNNHLRFHTSPKNSRPFSEPAVLWKIKEAPAQHWLETCLGVGGGRDWVGSELVSAKGQKLRVIMKPINGCCQRARYAQSPPRYASSLPACPSAHDVHSTGSKVLTHWQKQHLVKVSCPTRSSFPIPKSPFH
jgi:hypothetical protein